MSSRLILGLSISLFISGLVMQFTAREAHSYYGVFASTAMILISFIYGFKAIIDLSQHHNPYDRDRDNDNDTI